LERGSPRGILGDAFCCIINDGRVTGYPFRWGPRRNRPPERNVIMRVLIAVIAGPYQGQTFRFSEHDVFLVGRSKKAHFRLPHTDEYFSRLQFLVEINPPHCRLMDMGSTNGTHVNGQNVANADLKDGDLIQGGQTVMRVSIEEEDEPVTRVAAAAKPSSAVDPFPTMPPPPRGPTTGLTAQCVVCAAPAAIVVPASDSKQTAVPPWPVCFSCQVESQQQPQAFPNFRLIRELGRGGMGVVYLALNLEQGHVVALKTIIPENQAGPQDVERFLREARILQQLDHPHIVAFREMGEFCGQFYFGMDFVAGENAESLLKRDGPLPIGRAVHLVAQALEALHYAHQRGFVHRDVKPANLLVSRVDGQDFAKVLDFGLARAYQLSRLSGLSVMGQVAGTVPFMAPEQITNFRESRPPVDQYATAATLYNLLTGKYVHDFPTNFQLRLRKILEDEPVPIRSRRPEVPESLAAVIHRALAREPENRFPDAAAFRDALLNPKAGQDG